MGRVRAGLVNMCPPRPDLIFSSLTAPLHSTLTPRAQPAIGFFAAGSGGGSARAIMLSTEQSVDWKAKDRSGRCAAGVGAFAHACSSEDSWDENGSSGLLVAPLLTPSPARVVRVPVQP
jgi:hypothetical protein